ncbi:ankyrin repeat protein [Elusimicrobium simillimum]|uniref:ankyrin repeat domain-containing protein n=1 Tax=Elusimicrobium simillimum TaxID=3143438 RepID=UPI003C6F4AC4
MKKTLVLILLASFLTACAAFNTQKTVYTGSHADQLGAAIAAGDLKQVKKLVTKSNVNDPITDKGLTALYIATYSNQPAIVEYLIQHGADVNFISPSGEFTPISTAALLKNLNMVKLLVLHGADVNLGAPIIAACVGDTDSPQIIEYLLDNHADVNVRGYEDTTALITAASWQNLNSVKLLVENGAKVNVTDRDGLTPLAMAVIGKGKKTQNTLDVITYLLDHRSSVLIADKTLGKNISITDWYDVNKYQGAQKDIVIKITALLKERQAQENAILKNLNHNQRANLKAALDKIDADKKGK